MSEASSPPASPARPSRPRSRARARVDASDAVRAEWARRVQAEYRSAAVTQHLTLWLIQIGASPDLIHAGLRIVRDELAHASMSHRTFLSAGGEGLAPVPRESLGLRQVAPKDLEAAVTRACVEVFCLGETVAVPLFKVLREECTVPVARACLDRVLRDEVRHRDFGWALLDHLLELPFADAVRSVVERELPEMFSRVRRSYMPRGGAAITAIPAEDRAWGLMPSARYGEVLERAVERDYRPRFAGRGFDAPAAWRASAGAERTP